jgi:hypothetical protein
MVFSGEEGKWYSYSTVYIDQSNYDDVLNDAEFRASSCE